jgi:hypothetical protein
MHRYGIRTITSQMTLSLGHSLCFSAIDSAILVRILFPQPLALDALVPEHKL